MKRTIVLRSDDLETKYELIKAATDLGVTEGLSNAAYKGAFEAVEKYITNKPKDEPESHTTDIVMLAMEMKAECMKRKCNECPFFENLCSCRLAFDRPNRWQLNGLRDRRNENE